MDVGRRIKKYREINNISQDELAIKIFVSRQTISNWETNKSYPDIKSLSLLTNIFNVTLDDFIKGDIEEMKNRIDNEKINKFNLLGLIYSIELTVLITSAYPLFKFLETIGFIIWIIILLIALVTAFVIEKFKKNNDIQTYKEILAFTEGKCLTHDEKEQEFGKRFYQKFFAALICGLITFIVFLTMMLIFGK